jgi:hypothetical protein
MSREKRMEAAQWSAPRSIYVHLCPLWMILFLEQCDEQ